MKSPDPAFLKCPSGTTEEFRTKFIFIIRNCRKRLSRVGHTGKPGLAREAGLESLEQKHHVPLYCQGGCKGELCP